MIHFFNDRKLAAELRDGAVSEQDKFLYFMLSSIWLFYSASRFYTEFMYQPAIRIEYIADFITIVISIAGTWLCFDVNQEGDGRNYIERMTCIGFPAFVQVIILGGVLVFPLLMAADAWQWAIDKRKLDCLAGIAMCLFFYYRMVTAMRVAAGTPTKTP